MKTGRSTAAPAPRSRVWRALTHRICTAPGHEGAGFCQVVEEEVALARRLQ